MLGVIRHLLLVSITLSVAISAWAQVSKKNDLEQATQDEFAGKLAGDAKELAPGMKCRWCPPGEFTMGTPEGKGYRSKDEEPVTVTLTSGFWLGEAEVTQDQWKSVMKTTPWKGKKNVKEGGDYPAVHISHGNAREEKLKRDSATEFCRRLTEQEHKAGRLPAGWMYVLPTEAQWEYGCRAATATKFYFGDDKANLSDYGWWGGLIGDGNAKSEPYAHRVRLKKPNAWGLYDMHGNVNEWCADSYREKLPGGRDPVVVTEGTSWTWRGGCWAGHASNCGSAIRTSAISDDGNDCLGFRVAIVRSSK